LLKREEFRRRGKFAGGKKFREAERVAYRIIRRVPVKTGTALQKLLNDVSARKKSAYGE